jgi:AcrR family transcriptional regulator
MATTRLSARQQLLNVASDLFYREGIRSVSMDKIVEKSGVSKATLYRHFPTKDDLIVTYLKEHDHHIWHHYDVAINQHEGSAKAQLYAVIDATIELLKPKYYRGCPFLNVLAEFPEENHPAHQLALEYNNQLRLRLSLLSQQAGVSDEGWTDQLLMVINGAYSSLPVLGFEGAATKLKTITTQLIEQKLSDMN